MKTEAPNPPRHIREISFSIAVFPARILGALKQAHAHAKKYNLYLQTSMWDTQTIKYHPRELCFEKITPAELYS